MSKILLEFQVVSYEESEDTFSLQQVESNIETSTIDVDRFDVPAIVVACLLGEWGEPHELVGKTVKMRTPD